MNVSASLPIRPEANLEPQGLGGVIAAAATPVTAGNEPDIGRFVDLCAWLLSHGCDGLNICGTTGEATSMTVVQRKALMSAAAAALPRERLMAGTGAAAFGDAMALTREAAELGLAGALLLPPFYYKGVDEDGILRCFEAVVEATSAAPIDLYLYNIPALSGVPYTPALTARLRREFGARIAGLKDSSGDLEYAAEIVAIAPDLRVFPSNEAVLLRAREWGFAGCISASANVNSPYCARAFHGGEGGALDIASTIRALLSRSGLIPSVKAALAFMREDASLAAVLPPLTPLAGDAREALQRELARLLV